MCIAKPNLTSWLFFHNMEKLFYNLRLIIYSKLMCQANILHLNYPIILSLRFICMRLLMETRPYSNSIINFTRKGFSSVF
jgi:hypothetical protein